MTHCVSGTIIRSFLTAILLAVFTCASYAAQDPLQPADRAFQAKDYGKAGDIYREVFIDNKKGPVAERALFGMARSDFKLKRYTEARLNLQRFLMAYPQSTGVNEAFFLLGYILLYEHKPDEALGYLDKVAGALKPKADIGRAEAALGRNDISAAEAIMGAADKKALEHDPRALYVRAAILDRTGKHKEAVAVIGRIPDPVLKEEDLRVEKASIYINASRPEDAEKLCKTVVADPVSMLEKQKAEKILAGIYERKGRVDEALQMYNDIAPFEHGDGVKMSVSGLYDKKGDELDALRYASLIRDKALRSAEVEKRLRQLMAAGDANAVDYILKFSVSLDKDSPFLITAARYLIEKGKKREGEYMLKKAESGVERGEAALSLAKVYFGDGKYAEARKSISPLLFENRYFIKASFILADIMNREGDLQGAIACMEKANKYSKDFKVSSRLADLYFETGDRTTAFKYYKTASDRGGADASLKTADLLFLSGKISQAGAYYRRALSQGLSDEKSLQWAYYQYGKIAKNNAYLKKAADSGGLVGEAAGIVAGRSQ